jgi:type II secretory pathway predicted ATPase ExeA
VEHLRHFGLASDPFVNDPVMRLYFASREHVDAERRLARGVRQGKGLAVLTGELGSGKTTVARHLLDGLEEDRFEASMMVILQAESGAQWLLTRIARQIGLEEPATDRAALLTQLFRRLVEVREERRHTVVLIDGAHQLRTREDLGELKSLLHLEHDERHLVTVLLVGLPDLAERLAADPALAQRVEVRVALPGLDAGSTAEYVSHRVRAAGGDPRIFEPAAIDALCRSARGLPRILNTLADNALYEAHLSGRRTVGPADVERAAADLGIACASAPAAQAPAEPVASPSPSFALERDAAPTREPAAPRAPERAPIARPAPRAEAVRAAARGAGSLPEAIAPASLMVSEAEEAPIFESPALERDMFGEPPGFPDDGPPKEEEIEGLFVDLVDEER